MMLYNQRIEVSRLRIGWFGRVAIMLFAAALLILLMGLAIVAAALVAATALVIGIKVWWQGYLGRGGQDHRRLQNRTLEAEYEVLSTKKSRP